MTVKAHEQLNVGGWTCPLPLQDYPNIVMGHGGGGKLSAELVEHLFLPAFNSNDTLPLSDSVELQIDGARLAFSTDSFVVRPLFFPGGSIGELAVHGTVNDLAMSGAVPLYLSCGFIVEEGLPVDVLGEIAARMGRAARATGIQLVTGDTKVVERGHGDGVYVNTSGIGRIPAGVHIAPNRAEPGDVVIVSGTVGDHGIAVMSVREGIEFETQIESDSAPLNELVTEMLRVTMNVHVLRDPTRGGVAATLNEVARASQVGIRIDERSLPVRDAVASACELLGLDPLHIANEGKLVAIVPPEHAQAVLARMQAHPLGAQSTAIGHVVTEHTGMVVAKTGLGATRIVDMQVGEQLPRIC